MKPTWQDDLESEHSVWDAVRESRKLVTPRINYYIRCAAIILGGGTALWRFDGAVIDGAVNGAGWLTRFSSRAGIWGDTWIVDGLVRLTGFLVKFASYPVRMLQTGLVQNYALFVVLGALSLLGYFIFR